MIKTTISGLFDVTSLHEHFPGHVGIETIECGGPPDDDDLIEPITNWSADIASPLGLLPTSAAFLNKLFRISAICPNRSITASPSNISNDNSYHTLPIPVNDSTDILEVSTQSEISKPLYVLPSRQNRGKPPYRYFLEEKVRYSIAN